MNKMLSLFLVVAALSLTAFAQEKFVRPVDEASNDASFLAFRSKLIAAAERKDVRHILSIVDPKIKNGFGGNDGIAAFKRDWKLTSKKSEFWKEFIAVIKNGGAFEKAGKSSFVAPYTFSSWPDDVEGFELNVIFGNNVNLRLEPRMDAEILTKLSYNVVQIQGETLPKGGKSEYPGWLLIKTLGGAEGYVKSEFVRSHIDYRAGFIKKRGVWKMNFFLAGD